jgi:hypothetical protein
MTTPSPLSVLFIFIGIALFGGGVFTFFRQRARVAQSLLAEGVVIELLQQRVRGEFVISRTEQGLKFEKKYLYRPVIRFETQTGRKIDFIASVASRPAPYQVGECVDVLYNPDDPQQAQINSFLYLWFYVLLLVFFGLFTAGMGVFGLLMAGF